MSEINCDCGYNYTQTGCPNCKHITIDYTKEYEQALANMQREYDRRGRRIEELEAKLADGDFDVVKTADIAEWREKLNKRFGIGDGRMKSLDVVFVEWSMAEPEWFHEFAHTAITKINGEPP